MDIGIRMNLYWVTTLDHDEDWFVIAETAEEATTFHEDAEGYEPGDAAAELVMEIPPGVEADPGWPSEEVLEACGAIIEKKGYTRIVRIGEWTFCEGLMESEIRALDDLIREKYRKKAPDDRSRETEH
jgi:hypothetical protein